MKPWVLFGLIAFAAAVTQHRDQSQTHGFQEAQLRSFESDSDGFGNYKFAFALTDGTKHSQQGELKNAGTDHESISVKGRYWWVAPDSVTYIVTYVADDKGFQPTVEQGPAGCDPQTMDASPLS